MELYFYQSILDGEQSKFAFKQLNFVIFDHYFIYM